MPPPQPVWTPHHPVPDQTDPKEVRRVKRRHGASESSQRSVIERYEREGYQGQFGARAGGRIMCFSCRQESDASDVEVVALHRLEWASDPADEMAIAAVICPSCGAKGTLSLSYGVAASKEDQMVLQRLNDPVGHEGMRPGV